MKPGTNTYHIISLLVWIGLGFFVMFFSYQLGLGRLHNPGPGLMPFLLGFFLWFISCYLLLTSLHKKEGDRAVKEEPSRSNLGKLSMVLASLFAYALLLEPLGFLMTTFFTLIFLFRTTNNRWSSVLLASVLTVFFSYVIFTYLGIQFPKGILKGL
jgi:putative tricarboxylic transport membrane protein